MYLEMITAVSLVNIHHHTVTFFFVLAGEENLRSILS